MIAKISLSLRKFRYACENFAILAKFPFFHCLLPASFSLHYAFSRLLFLHPRLDEIDENSYELGINQNNFDAKLEMMERFTKSAKLPKTTSKQNQ